MNRAIPPLTTAVLLLAACSGGDGGSQAATEQGAIDATVRATRGTFTGDSGAVLGFLNEECRASVDDDEIRLGLAFASALFGDEDFDLDDIEVTGVAEEFDGESAEIAVSFALPDGQGELDDFLFSDQTIDVIYENGRWVNEDCDFGDDEAAAAEELDEELAALGVGGTVDDPVPTGLAVPIGDDYVFSLDAYDPDAGARIEADTGSLPFGDEGDAFALLEFTVGLAGDDEPKDLSDLSFELIGSDSVVIDSTGCSDYPNELGFDAPDAFVGGAFQGLKCFTGPAASLDGARLEVKGSFFSDRSVVFDPATPADAPSSVSASSGPDPDGDATGDRTAPAPLGTAVDVGDGWTVTINGFDADGTAAVLAESDFNEEPPAGYTYALIDATYAYDGDEIGSAFSVDVGVVGDSNISATGCDFASVPNELDRGTELAAGGTVGGNVCVLLADGEAASAVAYVSAGFDDDPEFLALS